MTLKLMAEHEIGYSVTELTRVRDRFWSGMTNLPPH